MGLPAIDHLDVWVEARQARSGRGRGASKGQKNTGLDNLRNLILRLALSGKLTDQLAGEQAAVELDSLKENLGKVPFQIPKNWNWARLPDIAEYATGRTPSTKNSAYWTSAGDGVPWVSIADLNHQGHLGSTAKQISMKAQSEVFKSSPVKAGTILMSFKLTVGKTSILDLDAFHNEAIISVFPKRFVQKAYLFSLLPIMSQWGETKDAIKGKTLNLKSIAKIPIPVPPIEEQKRIVAKVDELMGLIDDLEVQTESARESHAELVDALLCTLVESEDANALTENWTTLSTHFDALFTTEESVERLRSIALRLAVAGKLVPQNQLEVRLEKTRNKKNKKKSLHIYSETIPENWNSYHLEEFGVFLGGGTPSKANKKYWGEGHPWVSPKDMGNDFVESTIDQITDAAVANSSVKLIPSNSIIFVARSGILKRKFPAAVNIPSCTTNQDMKSLVLDDLRLTPYFHLLFKGWEKEILDKLVKTGMTVQSLKFDEFRDTLWPIPPLKEQSRIVARVDELMTLCDALVANIRTSEALKIELAESVVHHASAS